MKVIYEHAEHRPRHKNAGPPAGRWDVSYSPTLTDLAHRSRLPISLTDLDVIEQLAEVFDIHGQRGHAAKCAVGPGGAPAQAMKSAAMSASVRASSLPSRHALRKTS
ncbi:hypothetical protein PNO31109_00937 [Pandoraea nosoerga]|uniref:Uncharacterized protein n=1 Tax=Pandoraea nosoerga TaxID=2508296 RepID=A0A5E4SSS0_9BURK|nr:hypothetical protein PNO31109_00937 [Pandoraea nosoerga]